MRAVSLARPEPLLAWRERMLVYGQPVLGEAERRAVLACLDSGWIGAGPCVAEFEAAFARYVGSAHAISTNACTSALYLSLVALDAPRGSEVVTSALTWCASANAIVMAGLVPVFVDCDPTTVNITPQAVEEKIGPRTVAILPVHYAGRAFDVVGMADLARRRGLTLIEDAAHAIETTIGGKHAGTFGRFGCFSFYANKNVTTGEGGMVVTDDAVAAARLRRLATGGVGRTAWDRFNEPVRRGAVYDVVEPSLKLSMNDLAASLGLCQLASIDAHAKRRRELWALYDRELAALPLHLPPPEADGEQHARHIYTCLVDPSRTTLSRDDVRAALLELRIGTGQHYQALHLLDYYRRATPQVAGALRNTEAIAERTFSLPLSAAVSDDDARDVVRALQVVFDVER